LNRFGCAFVALTAFWSATNFLSAAAEYPVRPIRYIVPAAAGGAPDAIARLIAAELTRQMNQQVVVDNRPGAGGSIGMELTVRAVPDGYTIGHGSQTVLALNQYVLPNLPYNPDRDLQKVAQLITAPDIIAVTLALPVTTVTELIDYAKMNPGKLYYASPGSGGPQHVGMELFKLKTGAPLVHVPYKASVQAIADLIAGRVHVMLENMAPMVPQVKAGRVRGLAVTTLRRSPAIPELPTVAESGVPGFEITAWSGLVVPAGVPKSIVAKLNAEVNKALALPSVKARLAAMGYDTVGGTPEQFTAFVKSESTRWADVVKRTGAKVD
jgi:tripartite-type tricarboxylate transporter receptor subunit TctC